MLTGAATHNDVSLVRCSEGGLLAPSKARGPMKMIINPASPRKHCAASYESSSVSNFSLAHQCSSRLSAQRPLAPSLKRRLEARTRWSWFMVLVQFDQQEFVKYSSTAAPGSVGT
jgi:hypothetical protein